MKILSIGDRINPGTYILHSAFKNVLNYKSGSGQIIALVTGVVGSGPVNIVISAFPDNAKTLLVSECFIELAGQCIAFDGAVLYDSKAPVAASGAGRVVYNLANLRELIISEGAPKSLSVLFSEQAEAAFTGAFDRAMLLGFKKAAALFDSMEFAKGAAAMSGLGFGLTPSGDDFLCGFLTGLNFLSAPEFLKAEVYGFAKSSNALSEEFLRLAYEGQVNAAQKKLLQEMTAQNPCALHSAACAVFKHGHSSGVDFCAGLVYGCESVFSYTKQQEFVCQ